MNKAWMGLEIAPEGSMKNKIHGFVKSQPLFCVLIGLMFKLWSLWLWMYRFGLKLLARVKPSEIFLKSISKEVTSVQVSYPPRFYSLYLFLIFLLI